jgi:TPR repeat protein
MGVTPARRLRDLERSEALRDAGRQENELKFTEFRLGCEAGSVEACNSLGEWYALMRQDFHAAMEYYTPGCFSKKYAQSCLNYGLIAGELARPYNIRS